MGFDCRLSIRRCQLVTHQVSAVTSAYLFQISREKSCDYVLITYITKYHNCAEAKRAHQVKKNNLFKPFVRSKQPRTTKTIIYNYIFTSLGLKKFNVRPNSSRNCSVSIRITLDEMESSFARFNYVCL